MEEYMDKMALSSTGEFAHNRFDFLEADLEFDATETIEDVVDKKIFKYKYRMVNDSEETYYRRMDRVMTKSLDRAENRDPMVEADLH